jgi:hypothetical protein
MINLEELEVKIESILNEGYPIGNINLDDILRVFPKITGIEKTDDFEFSNEVWFLFNKRPSGVLWRVGYSLDHQKEHTIYELNKLTLKK